MSGGKLYWFIMYHIREFRNYFFIHSFCPLNLYKSNQNVATFFVKMGSSSDCLSYYILNLYFLYFLYFLDQMGMPCSIRDFPDRRERSFADTTTFIIRTTTNPGSRKTFFHVGFCLRRWCSPFSLE